MSRPIPPRSARALALGIVTLAAVAAPAAARELFWRSIDVRATLRADGALVVAETQAMVMSGDWNGGERVFRVGPHQTLRVERVVRIDPETGAELVLQRGNLSKVDHFEMTSANTLRWRSRAADAPPFDQTLLVYRIELVYERVFEPAGDAAFALAHDFAFADRVGPIEKFSLELAAAPGWQLDGDLVGEGRSRRGALPARFEAGPLPPGASYVVRGRFAWTGAGSPALAAPSPWGRRVRLASAALVAASALFWGVLWWRRDALLGRFEAPPEAREIDATWLEQKVFSERPEVIGAAWDRSVGSAEVAAMLARFVAEGRVASSVRHVRGWFFGHDVLELELRVPREQFDGDEKGLINGLFPSGDKTDTDSLRAHYSSTGFDPVSKIRGRLEQRVRSLAGFGKGERRWRKRPTLLLLLAGVALTAVTPWLVPDTHLSILAIPVVLLASIPAWIGVAYGRSQLGLPGGALFGIAVSTLLAGAVVSFSDGGSLGAAVFFAGLLRGLFASVATPESALSLARRRELAAARRLFAAELERAVPRLEDRWFPWLVALGLAPECDSWSKRFQVASATRGSSGTFSGGGSPPSSSSAGGGGAWSGGGGSFGGAGASVGFATAVTTLAAGVPSPSSGSSSSGGGGGGGGSSSGGGGGGGW